MEGACECCSLRQDHAHRLEDDDFEKFLCELLPDVILAGMLYS